MLRRARACNWQTMLLFGALIASSVGCHRRSRGSSALVYASDEAGGDVVAIDVRHAKVVDRIAVGKRPRAEKLSRDGKALYVALSGSPRGGPGVDEARLPPADRAADGIVVVDLATRKVVRRLPAGQAPASFDLSPDGKTLFVANEETAEMTVVDVASGVVRTKVTVGAGPDGVTVRPDGKVVFVASTASNEVTAVDTATFSIVGRMPTASKPRAIVVSKDGLTAFVTDEGGATVTVLDATAFHAIGDISVHEDSPMPSGPRPMGEALSPDGKTLYVTCGRGGSVAVIDVATRTQLRSIDGVGDRPWGVAVSGDGSRLYTANGTSHDVSIVNLATGNVETRVHVDGLAWGIVAVR